MHHGTVLGNGKNRKIIEIELDRASILLPTAAILE